MFDSILDTSKMTFKITHKMTRKMTPKMRPAGICMLLQLDYTSFSQT